VHISELAAHHVENPREVVSQGEAVNVRILEIDGERRRLSLSLKRVEEGDQPVPRADGAESVHTMPMPDLKLSEEAFPTGAAAAVGTDGLGDETEAAEAADEETDVAAEPEPVEPVLEVEAEAEPVVLEEADVAEEEAEAPAAEAAEEPALGAVAETDSD
jgi:small subunit ribosomal protein S1